MTAVDELPEGPPLERFRAIIHTLLAPGGCPWDRKQTHESLWPYLREETYELRDAIAAHNDDLLLEELGDVLLQVFMHAAQAEERGVFTIEDVAERISTKMIHRHPHVFGSTTLSEADDVVANWDALKSKEKGGEKTLLDGVGVSLPALVYAEALIERTSRRGYDLAGSPDNAVRELGGILSALTAQKTVHATKEEIGNMLLAVAVIAREVGVDAEEALHDIVQEKRTQFEIQERVLRERGVDVHTATSHDWTSLNGNQQEK
ncbi:MAG: nucleoside triphosphate pyrophosphohydrolase [Candidatus Dormibacteria bacterium]